MNKKLFLVIIVVLQIFCLSFLIPKTYATYVCSSGTCFGDACSKNTACKSGESYSTCSTNVMGTCSGGTCGLSNPTCRCGTTDCNSANLDYPNNACNPICPSGWSFIDPGNSTSCTVECGCCGNTVTCYKAAPPAPTTYQFYYCRTSDYSCQQTKSFYTDDLTCENSLNTNLPGQTDGACYSSLDTCKKNCNPPGIGCSTATDPIAYCDDGDSCTMDSCNSSTGKCVYAAITTGTCTAPPPTVPCVGWDCPSVNGQCGFATSNLYTSSSGPSSGLCSKGYQSVAQIQTIGSKRYWKWVCYGTIGN